MSRVDRRTPPHRVSAIATALALTAGMLFFPARRRRLPATSTRPSARAAS
jgi:hypothetical protein